MVLANYVKLTPDVPKLLHFIDHAITEKTIMDPLLKRPKTVRSLVFFVDEEDGAMVTKTFSIISEKLAARLWPYVEEKKYVNYNFRITQRGRGFLAEYEVEVIPR